MNNIFQISADNIKMKAWPAIRFLSRMTYITNTYTHE